MFLKIVNKILRNTGYLITKSNNLEKFPDDSFYDQKVLVGNNDSIIVFDVGAHFGETAIKYSRLFNNCKIYSFEPFEDSYNSLNEAVKYEKSIITFKLAVGNIVGEVEFHINESSATNSILSTHAEASKVWGENLLNTLNTIKVPSTTIDDFVDKNSINLIDILKLDTQGTEYQILEGAIETMQKKKIKLIYLEIIIMPTYHGQKHFDEILYMLRVNGFRLFRIYNYSYTQFGDLRQVDAIFLSENFNFQ